MENKQSLRELPVFFIVGRPRSGTTLLRTLFDAHPNVCIPPECKFILDLYPKYRKLRQWTDEDISTLIEELQQQLLFDTWKIDIPLLRQELLKMDRSSSWAEVCKLIYLNYQSFFIKKNIKVFGDKNPGYTIYTKRLRKIFSNAKFIHITRDYRDNFLSIKKVDFELPIISSTVTKWNHFVKSFNKEAAINPDVYTTIRMEDLVTEPEKQYKRLCEFINIPYDEGVFDFYKKKDDVINQYSEAFIMKYQKSLMGKINPDKVDQWKKEMTSRQLKIADASAGKYAEIAGYERKYKKTGLGIFLQRLPGKLLADTLRLLSIIIDCFPYRLRMFILNKGPYLMAIAYLRVFDPKKYQELRKNTGGL